MAATEAATKAGTSPQLMPKIRFHDLRHSHATDLLPTGIDVKTVSARLGHSSTQRTLNTYAHTGEPMNRDAAARIDALHRRPADDGESGQQAAAGA